MQLAILKGEKSVDQLAARLFQIPVSDVAATKQASAALLQANPQLANLGSVPAGSVIVVPATPSPINTAELTNPATLIATNPANVVSQHVTVIGASLANLAANAAAQKDATLKIVADPSVVAAAANNPILAQHLATISQNAQNAVKDVQTQQATLLQAITQMQQDLQKFLKPAGA